MGVTEVTQAQWKAVMNTELWGEYLDVKTGEDIAASCSWDDATAFCVVMSKKTGHTVRLPTEAEWEYACRAGTTTACHFGNDPAKLGDYEWYRDNAWGKGEMYPHVVGVKKPNAWGLYDMHGNVCEWCAGWYADSPNADTHAPKGAATGMRVFRGGTWCGFPHECRAASRDGGDSRLTHTLIGFRVVVESGSGVE